jgi:hypothetical protein
MFSTNPFFWDVFGTHTIEHFRPNASNHSSVCGHDVTFAEFVKYVIRAEDKNIYQNEHFTPSFDQCSPCHIKYDIIGKMETFKQDIVYILNKAHAPGMIESLKNMSVESIADEISDIAEITFKWCKTEKFAKCAKCITFEKALRRSWRKLQIKCVISKSIAFPFSSDESETIREFEFKAAMIKAAQRTVDNQWGKENRQDALLEAYYTVPIEDMNKLQNIFQKDFELFQYEPRPSMLFQRNQKLSTDFSYFDWSSL